MAVHNYSSLTTVDFANHIKSRSPCMNTGLWLRTLVISATTTSVTLVLLLFSMFSSPMTDSWLSWAHVHQHLSEVNIMEQPSASIETLWWGLRSITLAYIIVAVAFGEETRDIVQYFSSLMRERFSKADLRALVPRCVLLPLI
jgi:pheromone a factor receptor